jgi:hypothetical protein
MTIRSCLLVAAGVAAGAGATSLSPRPAAPVAPPHVGVRTGHVEGGGSIRALRPLSVRVGDRITRLGPPGPPGTELALVPLDVNGVPVLVALGAELEPAGPPPADDPVPPPTLQLRAEVAPAVISD